MPRPPLLTPRDSDGRGRREINGQHAGGAPSDDRRGRGDEQRAAGGQTPTRDSVHPGESAAGASTRGAQCPRAHESLPFRAPLQAKHGRAPASIPGSAPDRRGASVTGGPNGADRRDLAIGGISDAESLHDDVSADHGDDTEHVPRQRGRRRRAVIEGLYQPLAHRASWRGDRNSTLYCPGERPVWSRKTRERWEPSTKPATSATRSSL